MLPLIDIKEMIFEMGKNLSGMDLINFTQSTKSIHNQIDNNYWFYYYTQTFASEVQPYDSCVDYKKKYTTDYWSLCQLAASSPKDIIIPELLKDDKHFALILVSHYGLSIENFSDRLKDDEDVAMAAVSNDGHSLEHLSKRLKYTKRIVLKAVSQNGFSLAAAPYFFQNNKEVVLTAVHQEQYAIAYASPEMQEDIDVQLAANYYPFTQFTMKHPYLLSGIMGLLTSASWILAAKIPIIGNFDVGPEVIGVSTSLICLGLFGNGGASQTTGEDITNRAAELSF
jgi:hypothetical protein